MAVALYARVSTTKQAEKDLSIPDQLQQMRNWCKTHGYDIAVEYVESGASATDDRRPEFQRMIREATLSPPPFEAIIIHSLSRFFRDSIEFGLYERKLNKAGVKLISITQQTSEDPAGEMARRIFSLFDEYQSKENSKHTLRAMKENARQGFFNGSTPPYGYRTVEVPWGNNKIKKKRLEVDPTESAIVNNIFQLYLYGHQGRSLGANGISAYLNDRGITIRGRRWARTLICNLLANHAYIGEYTFNKHCNKTNKIKPESEWVTVKIDPIVNSDTFQKVERLREQRSPEHTPPRLVNSPTLLTGILKCLCGRRMVLATGKGGRYRYYKCSSKINNIGQSGHCNNRNVPMEMLDNLVLQTVSEKVFTPDRVKVMLAELQNRQNKLASTQDVKLKELTKELETFDQENDRIYEAIEKGLISMDSTLQTRVQKRHSRRQEILLELAGMRRQKTLPLSKIGAKHISAFCSALKKRFMDKVSNFGKEYLKLLVSEINVEDKQVRLKGSYSALAGALVNKSIVRDVPSFDLNWLPG